jgi:hypothetical protein
LNSHDTFNFEEVLLGLVLKERGNDMMDTGIKRLENRPPLTFQRQSWRVIASLPENHQKMVKNSS